VIFSPTPQTHTPNWTIPNNTKDLTSRASVECPSNSPNSNSSNSVECAEHALNSHPTGQVVCPQGDSLVGGGFPECRGENPPTEEGDPCSTSETEQLEKAEADATYFASRPDSSLESGGMLKAVGAHCQLVGKVSVADIREAFHVSRDEAVGYAREVERSRKAAAAAARFRFPRFKRRVRPKTLTASHNPKRG
jgi:hypothetical protein